MIDFAYARAESESAAVAALADDHATVLAGGTELLNWVRLGIAAPERVVDIGGLDGLRGITRAKGPRTTVAGTGPETRSDLVERSFMATAPDRLWVADITY